MAEKKPDHFIQPGQQLWKLRKSHGRPFKFKTGQALWEKCCEYFEWVEKNPLKEEKVFAYQGEITRAKISKMRAMTLDGLYLFLGIDQKTWFAWRGPEHHLSKTVSVVETVIREQKFTGAAADLLNHAIIARDLGLVDKQEKKVEHTLPHLAEALKAAGEADED